MFTFIVAIDWAKYRRNVEVKLPRTVEPTLQIIKEKAEEIFTMDAKCEKAAPWHSGKDLTVSINEMFIWDSIHGCWSTLVLDCQLRELTQIWCLTSVDDVNCEKPNLGDIPKTRSGFSQLNSTHFNEPLSSRLIPMETPVRRSSFVTNFDTPLSTPSNIYSCVS